MARRPTAETINKGKHVRNYLALNPSAGPKQVHQALLSQGIDASPGLVSRIKYGSRRVKKARRGRAPKTAPIVNGPEQLSLEHLLAAKKLAMQLGSVESAKQAVDALAKLS